jgi:hypothetical protein
LRAGVGDPLFVAGFDRTDVFFLIDRGSIVLGAVDAAVATTLGVVSVLPVGWKGCRLLRGMAVGMPWYREGIDDGRGGLTNASCARSSSMDGRSIVGLVGGLFDGGRGDGLLGPRGRRSCECSEVDREARVGESVALVGVFDSGRCIVEL